MEANDVLVFLILFVTGLMVLVFIGIVYMTGVWVRMAERLKSEGKSLAHRGRYLFAPRRHLPQH